MINENYNKHTFAFHKGIKCKGVYVTYIVSAFSFVFCSCIFTLLCYEKD